METCIEGEQLGWERWQEPREIKMCDQCDPVTDWI